MNSWLFRSLVALYPKAWRERYSKEVGDLSAELLAAGEVTRLRLVLELLGSAFAERVRSLHRSRFALVLSGSAALVVVMVVAFLATNGFGLGGSTSPRVTRVGWGSVGYRDAQVSFPPSFEIDTPITIPGKGAAIQVMFEASSPASCGVYANDRPLAMLTRFAPAFTPAPAIFGLANMAENLVGEDLAPGEMVGIYGTNLGPDPGVLAGFAGGAL